MDKIRLILIATALLSAQSTLVYAANAKSKPCAVVAKKCTAAGFARTKTPGKNFWKDCMKPVMLGHSVPGVTIDAAQAQACRVDKINEFKRELQDLEQAASTS